MDTMRLIVREKVSVVVSGNDDISFWNMNLPQEIDMGLDSIPLRTAHLGMVFSIAADAPHGPLSP
jgi:hypothetical protein